MSRSNASMVFASSDRSQTGSDLPASGCGNENIVSKTGDAIDRIDLCVRKSTSFGPPDRRMMSAVGELLKSCGIAKWGEGWKCGTARTSSVTPGFGFQTCMIADDVKLKQSPYDEQRHVNTMGHPQSPIYCCEKLYMERGIPEARSGECPHPVR
jgi:hypothetical protein